ncbi:hypothetical protein BC940DRAFT_307243 [Gongronella butleri]|nr:hypothetical protein BC940DRAFT_307243 [Gongronella butleri]
MTGPPIEFLLHPPSPKKPPNARPTTLPTLPPVSDLIQTVDNNEIPSIRLPTSPLMLSIPYEPSPSTSSSPSASPYLSYQSLDTPQSSPCLSPQPYLLPPPSMGARSRSPSNASTCSWSTIHSSVPSSPIERRLSISSISEQTTHQLASAAAALLQPSTSTSSTMSDPVIVKRKRGRPINSTKRHAKDQFTFVTPTVWDVKRSASSSSLSQQQQQQQDPSSSSSFSSSAASSSIDAQLRPPRPASPHHASQQEDDKSMLLLWHDPQHAQLSAYHNMNTFTSTRMDETLSMPRKKRGRKPKTQLAGNSCFVWRDLTARRGVNRKPKANNKKKPSPASSPSPSPCPSPALPSAASPAPLKDDADIIGWTKDLSLNDS